MKLPLVQVSSDVGHALHQRLDADWLAAVVRKMRLSPAVCKSVTPHLDDVLDSEQLCHVTGDWLLHQQREGVSTEPLRYYSFCFCFAHFKNTCVGICLLERFLLYPSFLR